MSHEQTAKQLMYALPSKRKPRGDPELDGRIMLKTWHGHSWNTTGGIATSCRRSGCLEIPIRAAASATPKGKAGKEKYTKLIQCFPLTHK